METQQNTPSTDRPLTAAERSRLQDERHRLMHQYGFGPSSDGAVRDRIAAIDLALSGQDDAGLQPGAAVAMWALERAAARFRQYQRHHENKLDAEKAASNSRMAEACEHALAELQASVAAGAARPPASEQEIRSARFRLHVVGSASWSYEFYDSGILIETGPAAGPREIWSAYDRFCEHRMATLPPVLPETVQHTMRAWQGLVPALAELHQLALDGRLPRSPGESLVAAAARHIRDAPEMEF